MTTKKYFFILCLFLFQNNCLIGQNKYELLYLHKDFESIQKEARALATIQDYYWLAYALNAEGNTQDAIRILEDGLENYTHQDTEILQQLISDFYYNTGNYTKAKPYLEANAEKPQEFLKLINILEFQGDYDKAIELLREKLMVDSLNLQYLNHCGDNYREIDSFNLAITYYSRSFVLYSEDQSTAMKLAGLYLKEKKFNKSIEVCDTILKSDSTLIKFIKIKGMAGFNRKDYRTAEFAFAKLLDTGDSSIFIYKHLGISAFNLNKYHLSREHLSIAFEKDTNDYETCFYLGKAYLNSPTPEKGIYFFDRVDSLMQPDPLIMSALYVEKQSAYSAIGDYSKALNCYHMAYEYNPKPEYLFFIASLYNNNLNNKKEALRYYNLFLSKLPPKPKSEHLFEENQITVSLRRVAESNIVSLKEELFFEE